MAEHPETFSLISLVKLSNRPNSLYFSAFAIFKFLLWIGYAWLSISVSEFSQLLSRFVSFIRMILQYTLARKLIVRLYCMSHLHYRRQKLFKDFHTIWRMIHYCRGDSMIFRISWATDPFRSRTTWFR